MYKSLKLIKNYLLIFILAITVKSYANSPTTQVSPVPVELGVFVHQLYDLDSNNGTFNANITYWIKTDQKKTLPLSEIGVGDIYTKFFVKESDSIWSAPIEKGLVFSIQSLGATFLHNYNLKDFPFDKQILTINFELPENIDKFIINADVESNINKNIKLDGWTINSFKLIVTEHSNDTNFGWTPDKRNVAYSRLTLEITVYRNSILLFFKLSLGLFASVGLALLSTLIRIDSGDHFSSRIGLVGGSLLAVIVNQQFADAKIGESTAVTLVDSLHIIGIIAILTLFISTIYSRSLISKKREVFALRHDKVVFVCVGLLLILSSLLLIRLAI